MFSVDEVSILLDNVENGEKLTKKQLEYHKKTKVRDLALLTLLLGTGIRVSECVGLNINDVELYILRLMLIYILKLRLDIHLLVGQ